MDHIALKKKEEHPRTKANILKKLFFLDTIKLFRKGCKNSLDEEDLYEVLPDYKSKTLGDKIEKAWEKQLNKKDRNSVSRLLWTCFGLEVFLLGLSQMAVKTLVIFFQPHALSKIIAYFNPESGLSKTDLYFWACSLLLFQMCDVIYAHNYHLAVQAVGIKIRAAFCSFIYRKCLKLSPSRLSDISVGKIITLITKDVQCLEHFSYLANDLWIAVGKTIVTFYVIYRKINIAACAGVGFLLIMLPVQFYLGTLAAKLRLKMCKKVDERLQKTQETLSAIKIIKMYTWEIFFQKKVLDSRNKEIKSMHWIFYLKFLILQIGSLNSNIAFYLLIVCYKWLGNSITADVIYYLDNAFHILAVTVAMRFPTAVTQIAEVAASVKRLGNVLKALEVEESNKPSNPVINPTITLKNVSVTYKDKQVLDSINLKMDFGVTLITGPVGSGKSFLLKTILKEFELTDGNVNTEGIISYASQEPWLFPSSIKQNILFGEPYDENRYQQVVNVCALCYDFELLNEGDSTIVEDRGNNLSKGQQARINLARAVYKDSDIYLLDDCLSALDSQVSDFIFQECIIKYLKNKLVVFVSHNVNHVKDVDNIVILKHGTVTSHSKSSEISEKEILEEVLQEEKEEKELDEDDDEETKLITETTTEKKVYQEISKTGEVDFKVYKKYLHHGGGIFVLLAVLSLYLTVQSTISYADKMISKWVNLEQKFANISLQNVTNATFQHAIEEKDHVFMMYSIMIILEAIFQTTRSFAFYAFIRKASLNLHRHMITHIINATMHFFDTNFIGNILNRFSKDLTTIDEQLPFYFHHVFRTLFIVSGITVVIATVNVLFLIPSLLFCGLLMIVRRYYLKTSRSLKRLDATTRSPIVGHMNATLEGLTAIRAFKAETILRDEYDRHQDLYTSASYIAMSSQRAFSFCLDMFCTFFIAIVISRFVFFDDVILAGTVGLAISQAMRMTGTLQWGVRVWADMENGMTSVERVLEYTEVKQETTQGQILDKWPTKGEVKYEKVSLTYTKSDDYVLKNINIIAKSKEKIGIVGRTGAGKSSIISTLFRLYETEGKILIDDVDIKQLSLKFLRKHISIIPQDPVLFNGTIRENIDPENLYSDDEIWKAIEMAYLTKLIPTLDLEITESGSSFSVGQRQLLCIVRAIVRNNRIIVLDEATANMDSETDRLVHDTITKCFNDCTVFTIAHKLHSIINCDKIIVLDRGEIIEYDDPRNLLKNKDGIFFKLAKKAGLTQ